MSETNGNGKQLNLPGTYRHKESGAVVELEATPGVGTPVIDAFVQFGYEYVEPSEVETVVSDTKVKK